MYPLKTKFDHLKSILLQHSETKVQHLLASELRQTAITHLEKSETIVAKSFRGEYTASGLGNYQFFLRDQAKPGQWGTYIEASALGEYFDVNVVVTPVKQGKQQRPICLYRSETPTAPTIHLYNSDNNHWYVNQHTFGDGNCLYNAFAQALQVISKQLFSIAHKTTSHGLFINTANSLDEAIIAQRQAIKNHPTPSQLEQSFNEEKARIAKLPVPIQQQITDDYQLALQLAKDELIHLRILSKNLPTKAVDNFVYNS